MYRSVRKFSRNTAYFCETCGRTCLDLLIVCSVSHTAWLPVSWYGHYCRHHLLYCLLVITTHYHWCFRRVWMCCVCFLFDADSCLLSLVKSSIFFPKWSCESGCQWPKSLKSQRVLIGSFQTYLEKSKCPNKSQKLAVLSNLLRRSLCHCDNFSSISAQPLTFTRRYNCDWHFSSERRWLLGEDGRKWVSAVFPG